MIGQEFKRKLLTAKADSFLAQNFMNLTEEQRHALNELNREAAVCHSEIAAKMTALEFEANNLIQKISCAVAEGNEKLSSLLDRYRKFYNNIEALKK